MDKGIRILVVDDERAIRRFLRASLTTHGHIGFAHGDRNGLLTVLNHRTTFTTMQSTFFVLTHHFTDLLLAFRHHVSSLVSDLMLYSGINSPYKSNKD